jgi:hypothetical protein
MLIESTINQIMVHLGICDQINCVGWLFFGVCTLTRTVDSLPYWLATIRHYCTVLFFHRRLNPFVSNIMNCIAFYPAEMFVVTLAFNRMTNRTTFVSKRATKTLFGGKRVYVGAVRAVYCWPHLTAFHISSRSGSPSHGCTVVRGWPFAMERMWQRGRCLHADPAVAMAACI